MTTLSDYAAQKLFGIEQKYPGLLDTSEGRIALTKHDPLAYSLVYLSHHLAGPEVGETISYSEAHLEWYGHLRQWTTPVSRPREWRHAYIAPRSSGKTSTWFLVGPLWAAAHGWSRFIAAFADSADQAQRHLSSFKVELETNDLLRKDYPDLCAPARGGSGIPVYDNKSMIVRKNGFVFAAKGVDSSSLGMKYGDRRPDTLVFDDIEPDAANYSEFLVEQRLGTLQNSLLPISEYARVVLVGTVTLNGSLVHQLGQAVTNPDQPQAEWISDECFKVYYHPAILTNDDGTERSLWPEKWSIDYLQSIRSQRSFWLNFMNSPMAADSVMWSKEDISYGELPIYDRLLISVDPAVTTNRKSDFTGIAVLGWSATTRSVYVLAAIKKKLSPKATRHEVAKLLEFFPEVRVLLVETNQGGELWQDVFADLPVTVVEKKQSVRKETRAEWLLNGYQKREVVHAKAFPELEGELLAFPRGLNDDLVDAVGTGFSFLTGAGKPNEKRTKPSARVASYV